MEDRKAQIEAAARNLMERFGDAAAREAERRIGELESFGDADALAFWRAVRDAVLQDGAGNEREG